MAKHPKDKSGGARKANGGGQPGAKRVRVEVSFEGDRSNKSKKAKVNAPSQAPSTKPPPAAAQAKDKGKARALPQVTTAVQSEATSSEFLVIAGSYEKLLYGLQGSYAPGSDKPTLQPVFIFPAHLAYVKAVASSPGGKWLATGSEDEYVKVWDLRRRKEVGLLSQHTGSITSLHFPTASHLVTTSEDSTLSLFRTSDWALLKSLKGHSGRVNNVDVHPTGRVALSVGKDKTLKMWDLMRGRGAASLPLGTEAELVKFSPLGTHFAVLYPKKIEVYSLTLKLLHTFTTTSRFNTMLFALIPTADESIEVLCVGTEKGVIEVYMVEIGQGEESESEEEAEEEEGSQAGPSSSVEMTLVGTLTGHSNRIKAISSLPILAPSGTDLEPTVLLSSVSSDGLINVYNLGALLRTQDQEGTPSAEPVASYDTKGTRLTVCCMAEARAVRAPASGPQMGDQEDEESDEEEEEEEDMYGSDGVSEDEEEEDGLEVEIESEVEDEEEYE